MNDDRFDNFPLMTDKIRVRSTDKGSFVQSNDEVMKGCLYGNATVITYLEITYSLQPVIYLDVIRTSLQLYEI